MNKILYTKETVLNKQDLIDYLFKFASDNIIKKESDKTT